MQQKRRNGRTTKTSVEDEIAHLRGLELGDYAHAGRVSSRDRPLLI